ncbi:MAG: hypothetical protein IJ336_08350 [Lachnospiraceae bacterium]|nr:hypothetical protein [Lachnospiraceae bacterium]
MEEKTLAAETVEEKKATENKVEKKTDEVKDTETTSEKKKGFNKKWGILIGAVLALGAGFVLLLALVIAILVWPRKVNLNDYVTVEFSGYDTVGTGRVVFEREAFLDKYGDKIKFSKTAQEYGITSSGLYGYSAAEIFADYISVRLSESSSLSNGQEVALVWTCDYLEFGEVFNYDIKYTEETFIVEGLEPVEMFDPFENLNVSFMGISPQGMVNLEMKDYSDVYEYAYFNPSESSGLANGDVITISFCTNGDPAEYCASNYGICPSVTEKEYVVEGLEEYISSLSQIPTDEENAMVAQCVDIFNAYVANNWADGCTVDSFKYQGSYLLTPKEGMSDYESIYYMVYKVNATWKYEYDYWKEKVTMQPVEFYYVVEFDVPIIDKDGNCVVDVTSYSVCNNKISYDVTKDWKYGGQTTRTLTTVGYWELEDVFTNIVQSKVDIYSYETNITN